MNIIKIPKPESPAGVDKMIVELQEGLAVKLPWLDHSFGRAQRLVRMQDGKKVYYPGVHLQGKQHVSVFPDDILGNFSFFDIDDPETYEYSPNMNNYIAYQFALIFWVNLDKIYVGSNERNTELLKHTIMTALRTIPVASGRIEPLTIFKRNETIYKGYNINEIDSQFLMQPFFGFRIEGNLKVWEEC